MLEREKTLMYLIFKKTHAFEIYIYSAAIAVTVGFACLSIVFSLLACVLDTNKEIGGNW